MCSKDGDVAHILLAPHMTGKVCRRGPSSLRGTLGREGPFLGWEGPWNAGGSDPSAPCTRRVGSDPRECPETQAGGSGLALHWHGRLANARAHVKTDLCMRASVVCMIA